MNGAAGILVLAALFAVGFVAAAAGVRPAPAPSGPAPSVDRGETVSAPSPPPDEQPAAAPPPPSPEEPWDGGNTPEVIQRVRVIEREFWRRMREAHPLPVNPDEFLVHGTIVGGAHRKVLGTAFDAASPAERLLAECRRQGVVLPEERFREVEEGLFAAEDERLAALAEVHRAEQAILDRRRKGAPPAEPPAGAPAAWRLAKEGLFVLHPGEDPVRDDLHRRYVELSEEMLRTMDEFLERNGAPRNSQPR